MRTSTHARLRLLALVSFAALVIGLLPSAQARPADVTSPQEAAPVPPAQTTPVTVVNDGVESFALWGKRLVWHQPAYCPTPPPASTGDSTTKAAPNAAADPVRINRLPTYGGARRTIYARNDPRNPGVCNPYRIYSNVVTDEGYVYWMDAGGLQRISVEAGPTDTPELLNAGVDGTDAGMIAIAGDFVYGYRGPFLFRTPKNALDPGISLGFLGDPVTNFQMDGSYLYYVRAGTLYRYALNGTGVTPLASGVTGYFPEGARLICTGFECRSSNYVYIAQGRTIRIFSNFTGNFLASTYTSSDARATAYRMITSGTNLFIFETRFTPCSPSPCFGGTYNDVLLRATRLFGSPAPLYARTSIYYGIAGDSQLASDGAFLFWKEAPDLIKRLPNDAAALPVVDVYPTRIEITQGVQRTDNSVLLVQRRRTFVRVFVQAATGTVNGVAMTLAGSWTAGGAGGGVLSPINSTGKLLAVRDAPDPNNIDHAFLFELPWDWTTKSDLRLRAEINPNQFPLEPTYANNVLQAGPFAFSPSPRLAVQYIMFGYELNGTIYYPRLVQDLIGNYSYLRRTYPLASTPGDIGDPSPGFRPNFWIMFDDGLSDRILQPSGMIRAAECSKEPFLYRDSKGNVTTDNRNLCASAYINSRLKQIRAQEGLNSSIFLYGMISDGGGFPRGQEGGDRVSSGPAGPGWEGYYAAHEVGHSLNRPHPNAGSDDPATTAASEGCGHSRSDPNYPYASTTRAPIGPSDGSVSGFDAGDPEVGAAREVKPSSIFNDYMSYCDPYWISDYTYRGMYDYMIANPSSLTSVQAVAPQQGDWLSVFGVLGADGASAVIHEISRSAEIGTVPEREDGPYAIQLLGGGGRVLVEYAFQPEDVEDGEALASFGQVVPWVDAARTVRIVHRASGRVLAERATSANAPQVSDVRLENATEPVTGTATLRWTASDADGDTLSYNVFWSSDNGMSFQPIRLDRAAMRMQIDTTQLGGGSGIFKVVASDGIATATALSTPVTLAAKPPTVRISSPGADTRVEWQQLVNFSADVHDLQDGTLPATALVWRDALGATLGTGPLLSKDDLPVGVNRITLTATNSAGLSSSDTVIVRVGDDLEYPAPTLSVSPARVGWTSPNGSATPLVATLDVSNVGGDSLSWTAASDAAWLTLSATSGPAPATLTLTADPTGMPASTTRSASVTFTATVNGAPQTVVVPVTLARGSATIGPPPPVPPRRAFAPLVRR